jgi:hypothetical protein
MLGKAMTTPNKFWIPETSQIYDCPDDSRVEKFLALV